MTQVSSLTLTIMLAVAASARAQAPEAGGGIEPLPPLLSQQSIELTKKSMDVWQSRCAIAQALEGSGEQRIRAEKATVVSQLEPERWQKEVISLIDEADRNKQADNIWAASVGYRNAALLIDTLIAQQELNLHSPRYWVDLAARLALKDFNGQHIPQFDQYLFTLYVRLADYDRAAKLLNTTDPVHALLWVSPTRDRINSGPETQYYPSSWEERRRMMEAPTIVAAMKGQLAGLDVWLDGMERSATDVLKDMSGEERARIGEPGELAHDWRGVIDATVRNGFLAWLQAARGPVEAASDAPTAAPAEQALDAMWLNKIRASAPVVDPSVVRACRSREELLGLERARFIEGLDITKCVSQFMGTQPNNPQVRLVEAGFNGAMKQQLETYVGCVVDTGFIRPLPRGPGKEQRRDSEPGVVQKASSASPRNGPIPFARELLYVAADAGVSTEVARRLCKSLFPDALADDVVWMDTWSRIRMSRAPGPSAGTMVGLEFIQFMLGPNGNGRVLTRPEVARLVTSITWRAAGLGNEKACAAFLAAASVGDVGLPSIDLWAVTDAMLVGRNCGGGTSKQLSERHDQLLAALDAHRNPKMTWVAAATFLRGAHERQDLAAAAKVAESLDNPNVGDETPGVHLVWTRNDWLLAAWLARDHGKIDADMVVSRANKITDGGLESKFIGAPRRPILALIAASRIIDREEGLSLPVRH